MSYLQMSIGGVNYRAKVLSFSTNLSGTSSSVQNRRYIQHFPVRVDQPSLSLQLQMRSTSESRYFQDLVRAHQLKSLSNTTPVRLFWGARGISDWSGFITSCQAGESSKSPIPKMTVEVLLVDSMVTRRTWGSSRGSDVSEIYRGEIPDIPSLDSSGYKKVAEKIYGEELIPPTLPDKSDKKEER